ncbi:tetratricopeptide repeat protein, partial [Sulfuricurvum sp.]|uniref:tetratricopeptide repeat protein n=1 Tax=Sulfuricurvum sp. TaxID=2025608 RepID=UPI002620A32F
AFQKAVEINPKYDRAFFNMGIVYGNKEEHDLAIEAYQKAIEINPKYAAAYFNMGIAYHNKGKYDRAIEAYQKAIEINPTDADAYLEIFEISLIKNKKMDPKLIQAFESNIEDISAKKIFEMLMILGNKIKTTRTDEVVNRWIKNYQQIDANWDFNQLERWAKGDQKAERWIQIFKENMSR